MKREEGCMDKILIKDLLLRCIIGTNESERREKQDILINIEMSLDFQEAARTDDITKSANYKEINKKIIPLVENSQYFLVETLAEKIAQICLENSKINKVKVSVEKPGALRFARSVGVEITRER
ncbi:dihydroneopterin aldolase [[Eubacterium] cellulosolvens]